MKTFSISLSKLRGRLFTIFTVYIVSVFLSCFYNGCACDRFSVWSCSLKRAVYSTPDSQCLECYIPFIHSRHNAKDMSLGMGRDIRFGLDTVIRIMDIVYFAIKSSHGLTEHNYSVSFKGCVRLQNN